MIGNSRFGIKLKARSNYFVFVSVDYYIYFHRLLPWKTAVESSSVRTLHRGRHCIPLFAKLPRTTEYWPGSQLWRVFQFGHYIVDGIASLRLPNYLVPLIKNWDTPISDIGSYMDYFALCILGSYLFHRIVKVLSSFS